jgi:hypothetical protein
MKGFLKYILLFFMPLAVLLATMELLLQSLPNNYKIKSDYIEHHSEDIETLILGNSHTYYGLNPEWMNERTFNMSNVSQSLDIDLAILDHYLPKMPQLKTVVIRLSYDSMFETLSKTDEHWRYKDYALYTDIPLQYSWKNHSEILSISFKENLKRIFKYYIKKEASVTCNTFGWGMDANSSQAKDLHKTGALVAQKHTAISKDLFDDNFNTLKNIADLCAQKQIQIVLVTPPAFESYYLNLNYQQLEATVNVGLELANQYDYVTYYNFLEYWRFDKQHFYDADHLNELGALLFSKMINDIIHK